MAVHHPACGRMSLMEFSLQALLARHETYMADAENQRKDMMAQLEDLEGQKLSLQRENDNLIEENRGLFDQLDALNNAVAESDSQVTSLQATLDSAHQEMRKLSQMAARTDQLERDLLAFENEQSEWQASANIKDEAEKSATRRWQNAERTLIALHDQLERIDRESKEEKRRHAEVVARLERRHTVERQLANTPNQSMDPAAAKDSARSTVVSHFVKDILQDNAALQMGIVELRELLETSNEEVENLRQQLLLHEPTDDRESERPAFDRANSLNEELNRAKGQQLHVHHHYHAPSASANRATVLRRPRKKRYGSMTNGQYSSTSSGRSTPRSSVSLGTPSSAAAILQQTATSIPQAIPSRSRWSAQSSTTSHPAYLSSSPSSPVSTTHCTSSIFDRVFSDASHGSSSPTTSDSETFDSPYFQPAQSNSERMSVNTLRTCSAPLTHTRGFDPGPGKASLDAILDTSIEDLPPLDHQSTSHEAIAEENESEWCGSVSPSAEERSVHAPSTSDATPRPFHDMPSHRPPLRLAASHESLLSISGMDIHTLKERPSQLLFPQRGGPSSGAVVSNLQAHAARPGDGSRYEGSSRSILCGMAADQRAASAAAAPNQTLRRKASGWIFGRWGAAPTRSLAPTVAGVPSESSKRAPSVASGNSDDVSVTPKASRVRSPGINQPGPIFGLAPELKLQHRPVLKTFDQEALKNALDES